MTEIIAYTSEDDTESDVIESIFATEDWAGLVAYRTIEDALDGSTDKTKVFKLTIKIEEIQR